MVEADKNIERINAVIARKLIAAGAKMELETVRLDGNLVWRVNIRAPNNPVVYRVIVYHTMQDKFFKNLGAAFTYFTEMMPKGAIFAVQTEPVEEITTDE